MTPKEQEILRQLRNGELTYVQENFTPSNVLRRPLPVEAPKAPPPSPKKE